MVASLSSAVIKHGSIVQLEAGQRSNRSLEKETICTTRCRYSGVINLSKGRVQASLSMKITP
jgi:hypothetical protein